MAQARHVTPLFWQHGEPEDVLREEIKRMHEAGCGAFIAESRPHPDYLGENWWRDLGILIDEAEKHDMRVWLFDDGTFPSGSGAGRVVKKHPEAAKKFLAAEVLDATGPLRGSYFQLSSALKAGEAFYRIFAARRVDRGETIETDSILDVTDRLREGRLFWDVPEGDWRLIVLKTTPHGEETYTAAYVNPIDPAAVRLFIEEVYEAHYAHFSEKFGKTVQGFFCDEPRFGNTPGYDRIIGHSFMPLPWRDDLIDLLSRRETGDFTHLLPLLWLDGDRLTPEARFVYMDVVSRLFASAFTGQIGDWCRAHGVRLIGHVVEENGAHARLGFGAGHFFRAMEGLDMAGIDVVCNLYPEQTSGTYRNFWFACDCSFNHWGLAKMASSAASLDPKKNGTTFCEAFGAYGWGEGLKLMKWITDELAVRGVNEWTPHAFSPKDFPDPDCPPHFYARGRNPQYRYFRVWADYASRLAERLSGGQSVASAAVLYHAEAEWGGEAMPFDAVLKTLGEKMIDADVVCCDALYNATAEEGTIRFHQNAYRVLIVPGARFWPNEAIRALRAAAEKGVTVLFVGRFPERCYFGGAVDTSLFSLCTIGNLADALAPFARVRPLSGANDLVCRHYRKNGTDAYFFVNQSIHRDACAEVLLPQTCAARCYDAMKDTYFAPAQTVENGFSRIRLSIPRYGSLFVLLDGQSAPEEKTFRPLLTLDGPWRIGRADAQSYPVFTPCKETTLCDMARPETYMRFSGTFCYETRFSLPRVPERAALNVGEAYETVSAVLNGTTLPSLICPPYRWVLPTGLLKEGENDLRIEVTNTLVKEQDGFHLDLYFPQEPSGLLGPVTLEGAKTP